MTTKTSLKNWLLKYNRKIVRTIAPEDLLQLLSELHPVRTQFELIKVGSNSDGAYLLPDDLIGIAALVSPGVSTIIDFELEMAKRGIKSYMIDGSIDGPPISNQMFDFERKFLGCINEDNFITLSEFMKLKGLDKDDGNDLLLQMDVEGAEWEILMETPSQMLKKFRILSIEFHALDCLVETRFFNFARYVLKKILNDFFVVHAHPNNNDECISYHGISIPPTIEFTFLRKERANLLGMQTQFPHPLDIVNAKNKPDFALPKMWHA